MLTQERLKEVLHYDPETGIFTAKVTRGNRLAGRAVGCDNGDGYLQIRIDNRLYFAHRLAFLWMTGVQPKHQIDHINGVRSDNRWPNLRDLPVAENAHNIGGPRRDNTSGFVGTWYDKRENRWASAIQVHRKRRYLGYFDTPELAHAAYLKAKDELHPTHQRLRNQGA